MVVASTRLCQLADGSARHCWAGCNTPAIQMVTIDMVDLDNTDVHHIPCAGGFGYASIHPATANVDQGYTLYPHPLRFYIDYQRRSFVLPFSCPVSLTSSSRHAGILCSFSAFDTRPGARRLYCRKIDEFEWIPLGDIAQFIARFSVLSIMDNRRYLSGCNSVYDGHKKNFRQLCYLE